MTLQRRLPLVELVAYSEFVLLMALQLQHVFEILLAEMVNFSIFTPKKA